MSSPGLHLFWQATDCGLFLLPFRNTKEKGAASHLCVEKQGKFLLSSPHEDDSNFMPHPIAGRTGRSCSNRPAIAQGRWRSRDRMSRQSQIFGT